MTEKTEIKFSKETIQAIKEWKNQWYKNWKSLKIPRQNVALQDLIWRISITMKMKFNKIPLIIPGFKYAYHYDIETIEIDSKKPSIISILHEFAHHLHGPNEQTACAWSIQLFKKCFYKSFIKLKKQDNLFGKNAEINNPNKK